MRFASYRVQPGIEDLLQMGILCIDGELILTLLLFHSHVDNVKMSLKGRTLETPERSQIGAGGRGAELSVLNV